MTVKVETYNHPRKWREHASFSKIKQGIHLCATRNVADGIIEQYQNDENKEFQHVFTIHQLFQNVFYKWHEAEYMLEQYLNIARIIRTSNERNYIKQSFLHNVSEIQNTIRMLAICNLSSEDLSNHHLLSNKEMFFKEIWSKYEKLDDEVYHKTKSYLTFGSSKKDYIIERLNKLSKSNHKNHNGNAEKQFNFINKKAANLIVLHGFYFITPEQQVFLKYLERMGFNLVFFQLYDERFPNTFKFIHDFISEQNDWTDNWTYDNRKRENEFSLGAQFLNMFEERENTGDNNGKSHQIDVTTYDSFFDFLDNVVIKHYPLGEKETISDVNIIATNADILNNLLTQYYPERYSERRNFLNYPVGQFLHKIHQMHAGKNLIMTEQILMTAFSSGWLNDKETGKNAQQYTYELRKLLPFFSDCEFVEDWVLRMENLIEIYKEVLPNFESAEDSRIVTSVRSPFTRLGYLSLDIDKVVQIQRFITILIQMASNLFDLKRDEVSITEHFGRLLDLMETHNPIESSAVLEKQETKLIELLQFKIKQIESEHTFLYQDIGDAISFYLSGKFDEGEDDFIKPIIEVDGEAFKHNSSKLYLTGLDEEGLPFTEFSTPWPFQKETFEILAANNDNLNLHLLRDKSIKEMSRYLLYVVFEFIADRKTEYSWIKNFLDREDLGPTIYLNYFDVNEKAFQKLNDTENSNTSFNNYDFMQDKIEDTHLNKSLEKLKHRDFLVEYVACPRRFYYGIILDKYSVFSSPYIYRFFYSELIKLVKGQTGLDNESTKKMVSEIFPQFNQYTQSSLSAISLKYPRKNISKSTVDDEEISTTRNMYQFPWLKNDRREKIYKDLSEKEMEILDELNNLKYEDNNFFKAKPSFNCRYCPFINDCSEAKYSIDEK